MIELPKVFDGLTQPDRSSALPIYQLRPDKRSRLKMLRGYIEEGAEISYSNRETENVKWLYNPEEQIGTLYLSSKQEIASIVYTGELESLKVLTAENYWLDQNNQIHGVQFKQMVSGEFGIGFYEPLDEEAMRIDVLGSEKDWFIFRGLPRNVPNRRGYLNYGPDWFSDRISYKGQGWQVFLQSNEMGHQKFYRDYNYNQTWAAIGKLW